MRVLGRVIILIFVLGLAAAAIAAVRPLLGEFILRDQQARNRPEVSEAVVYALGTESWTRFPFSNPPSLVRILANADVVATAVREADATIRYAIEYQILDATGTVLRQDIIHLGTRLLSYLDPTTLELEPAARYGNHDALPTASDLVTLDIGDLDLAAELRARFVSDKTSDDVDAEVVGAVLRIYERRPIRESRVLTAWERLSVEDRAMLARSSVFETSLLTSNEKGWLIRNDWLPIGPSGVGGVDYNTRMLITQGDGFEAANAPGQSGNRGLYLDAKRRVTLLLPEGGGHVRFTVEALAGSLVGGLSVVSYQPLSADEVRRAYPLTGEVAQFEDQFDGGMLEISAETPMRLRAFLLAENDQTRELTDELNRVRAYALKPSQPLRYLVTTLDAEATPLRIVLRCACSAVPGTQSGPVDVHYVISGRDQSIIREGQISVATDPSPYDRLSESPALPLSVPTEIIFNLPKGAASVSLFSDASVFAYGFTRPLGVSGLVMIPEDRFASEDADDSRRTWFYLRPEDWEAMILDRRAPFLEAPAPPPELDPEILAGRYDWEQFLPKGDWLGREMLIPADTATLPRPEALASSYVSIPLGKEQRLNFATRLGSIKVEMNLVYRKLEAKPVTITVRIDGKEVVSETAMGTVGSFALPPMDAGFHRVVVDGPAGITAFLNNVEGHPASLTRRLGIRLPVGETVFEIEKQTDGEELMVARVFPSANKDRQTLRFILEDPIRPIGPVSDWTQAEREYSIRAGTGAKDVAVLGTDQLVGPERRFVVPLGADLPAGRYTLRVVLEGGRELYLVLSRTTPGIVAQRDVVQE